MDCNKDEAMRAKVLAAKKMSNNDFEGARKIALKAQNLFPELENINQLLSVCDVHCSAQRRVGSEKDWYGILQVEKLSDELAVKKQYRRLALYLHPDKNQLPGAEGAFKLISEAHNVLSDKTKKSIYDSKLRHAPVNPMMPLHANQNLHSSTQFRAPQGFGNGFCVNSQVHPSQLNPTMKPEMFWTACPYCSMKCQYNRRFLHCRMQCHSCLKSFTAYEVGFSGVSQHIPVDVSRKHVAASTAFEAAAQGSTKFSQNAKVKEGNGNVAADGGKKSGKKREPKNEIPRKAKKPVVESSASCESPSESDVEMSDAAEDPNSGTSHAPRRSARVRKSISYSEFDDDDAPGLKKFKDGRKLPSGTEEERKFSGDEDGGRNEAGVELKTESHGIAEDTKIVSQQDLPASSDSEKVIMHIPDPEFSDFDELRNELNFAAGQFWALYDQFDGMPRFYAKVTKVSRSPFKLNISWLEADPVEEPQKKWVDANLPVGCGDFVLGKKDETSELNTLSHRVFFDQKKGRRRGVHCLYPREGEVWAVFRDFNYGWSSDPENHAHCKYDIVQILSDLNPLSGIKVCYLSKVPHFLSLFERSWQRNSPVAISPKELYRFAYGIPFFKMSGDEGEGVPAGSFELDPACLPANVNDPVSSSSSSGL